MVKKKNQVINDKINFFSQKYTDIFNFTFFYYILIENTI